MKRSKVKFCKIFLWVFLLFLILQVIPQKQVIKNNPFIDSEKKVLIAAHRGGKNLNPENTLLAFDEAITKYNVDILELDLIFTKDNYLVAIHNETLNETCDVEEILGKGKEYFVKDFTLFELKNFNFGYNFLDKDGNYPYRNIVGLYALNRKEVLKEYKLSIVTIDEIFERYKDLKIKFIIEVKDSGEKGKKACDYLAWLIKKYNLEKQVVIGSFHYEVTKYLKRNYPYIIRGGSINEVIRFVILENLKLNALDFTDFACLQIPPTQKVCFISLKLTKKAYLKKAHKRNVSIQFWTINTKEEMQYLIDLGADVIMTDSPDVLYELLKEIGYR